MPKRYKYFPDARGTEFEPGAIVAYNLSGDVALGRILEITSTGRLRIELLHDAAGLYAGHLSEVRRLRSALVLLKGDTPL